jgi:serine/threonine protein kinase
MKIIISESILGIKNNDFLKRNNIDLDSITYAGSGDFGNAYYVNENRILKITSSKSEYEYAKMIKEKGNIPILKNIVDIYDVHQIDNHEYYILMEELDIDEEIEDYYWQVSEMLNQQGLNIYYIENFDEDEVTDEIDEDVLNFMDELSDVLRAYRYMGVMNPDIKPDNLGRSSDGTLKAFDIDETR